MGYANASLRQGREREKKRPQKASTAKKKEKNARKAEIHPDAPAWIRGQTGKRFRHSQPGDPNLGRTLQAKRVSQGQEMGRHKIYTYHHRDRPRTIGNKANINKPFPSTKIPRLGFPV
ncbi:hypothetical protein L249_1313, partial [Ophiocordyceps polyrhachis-furcata BCC 54312]